MSEYLQEHYTNDEFDDIDVNVDPMSYPLSGSSSGQSYQQIGNAHFQMNPYNMPEQNYSPIFSHHSDGMDYKSGVYASYFCRLKYTRF